SQDEARSGPCDQNCRSLNAFETKAGEGQSKTLRATRCTSLPTGFGLRSFCRFCCRTLFLVAVFAPRRYELGDETRQMLWFAPRDFREPFCELQSRRGLGGL